MLVLRAVIDEKHQPRRRQALHEAIQHGLRLAVNPVQVLEDHDKRVHLALDEQQTFHSVKGALASLVRIEPHP